MLTSINMTSEKDIKGTEIVKKDDESSVNQQKPQAKPHPLALLTLIIATSAWHIWILTKCILSKDLFRWIWVVYFCFSCLTLTITSHEQIQLLTIAYPVQEISDTSKKDAYKKIFLINAIALPIGLWINLFANETCKSIEKDSKAILFVASIPYMALLFLYIADS